MLNIALDGPAGAGKSTLANALSKKYSLIHVDTGALYRAVGCYFCENKLDYNDASLVNSQLCNIDVNIKFVDGGQKVYINGADVTDKIRTQEVAAAASSVSAIPQVRAFLLDLQRDIAKKNDVIMDGRDIGTVVLPSAQLKIFVDATVETRAARRYRELREKGVDTTPQKVLEEVTARDHQDSTRDVAPMKPADDALILDTTKLTFEQAVESISDIIDRIKARGET